MLNLLEQDLWSLAVTRHEVKNAVGDMVEVSEEVVEEAVGNKIQEAKDYIDEELSKINSFDVEKEETLPEPEEAKENTIYFVPKDPSDPDNHEHYEYILVDGRWELIGDTGAGIGDDGTISSDDIDDLFP